MPKNDFTYKEIKFKKRRTISFYDNEALDIHKGELAEDSIISNIHCQESFLGKNKKMIEFFPEMMLKSCFLAENQKVGDLYFKIYTKLFLYSNQVVAKGQLAITFPSSDQNKFLVRPNNYVYYQEYKGLKLFTTLADNEGDLETKDNTLFLYDDGEIQEVLFAHSYIFDDIKCEGMAINRVLFVWWWEIATVDTRKRTSFSEDGSVLSCRETDSL